MLFLHIFCSQLNKMVSSPMPPAQATGTTNSRCQKFIKATAVDDLSEKSFCVSSDTLLVSVRPWYSKDIQPLYLVTDACAQFIQAPDRALDPLWIPCVTNLSERILFVEIIFDTAKPSSALSTSQFFLRASSDKLMPALPS